MTSLALSLKLSAVKGLSAIQRAINILKSAGPGAWYDPSDLTTLYQDSAGTTPVTAVEQPVGLILDKSQGLVLGAELVSSLDFATWGSSGVTLKSGNSFTTSGSGGCWLAVPGWSATKSYRLVISGTCTTAWNLRNADNSLNIIAVSSGAFSLNVPMTLLLQNSSGNLYFQPTGAATFTVTSISLKELPGNHLIQPTATSRPTLSSRYNLLTKTEQFDDAAWTKSISGVGVLPVVTPNAATAPDGTLTADAVTFNCPGSGASDFSVLVNTIFTKANGVVYTGEISVKAATGSDIGKVIVLRHVAVNTAVAITLTDSWQRVPRTEASPGSGIGFFGVGLYPLLGASTGSVSAHIWGASLTTAADSARPYQRVNTATDYDFDFSKFPPYLKFDGVDDSMYSAASIDFTSTDKITVFAGVHKASEVGTQTLLEMSPNKNSNTGVFAVFAPITGGNGDITWASKGTVEASALAAATAVSTRVLTGVGDISGDLVVLRLNGAQVASAATDQGTGNYGNHVLYVGRRNNASLPFNGRIYQLAIKGKSLSAGEVSTLESYINSKTKAF